MRQARRSVNQKLKTSQIILMQAELQILQFRRLCHRFYLVRHRRYYWSIQLHRFLVASFRRNFHINISAYRDSIMFFSYEERLAIFKQWFHIKFSAADIVAAEFYHESAFENINDVIICSKCSFSWCVWFVDDDLLQIHLKMYENCSLI